ncbi:MAG: LysR family transcriptional regulator [Rubrobacteraceae bacterium]
MELRQLKTFRAVAENLSFTRAAGELGYVQSSVTAQIQGLERELGVPLFDRIGRRVTLTDAGRRLLGYAEKMLELEEETRASVSADGAPAGTVTISAAETHCTYRLPRVIGRFRELYPQVRVLIRPVPVGTFCGDTVRDLGEGKADVAFVLDEPVRAGDLTVEPLVEEPVWLVAAPDHPLAESSPVRSSDLRDETLLLTGAGCSYRAMFLNALARDGVHPGTLLEFSGVEAIKQCAIAGMGVAVLPAVVAAKDVEAGSLTTLHWTGLEDFEVVTQMIRHEERWLSPAAEAFCNIARETLETVESPASVVV